MRRLLLSLMCVISFAAGFEAARADSLSQAPSPKKSYVPAGATLLNMNAPSAGKLCVIGYSQQKAGLAIGPHTFNIPAYYLVKEARGAAWRLATGNQTGVIQALEVGADISALPIKAASPSSPSGNYINAGNITFFFVKSPPAGFACGNIAYQFTNKATGQVNIPSYPYPSGLFEISTYPVWDGAAKTYSDFTTVDVSNVDSFELPLFVNVLSHSSTTSKSIAYFGNPISSPLISRRSMISGAQDSGGATSPFAIWIKAQGAVAAPFAGLALATPSYPYAFIQSPNDFLLDACQLVPNSSPARYIPSNCSLNGQLLNFAHALGGYFDAEMALFYRNAVANNGARLAVMGDSSGAYQATAWRVEGYTSCPLFLKPDTQSLLFGSSAYPKAKFRLCNPVGATQLLSGALPSGAYVQVPVAKGVRQTATISLTKAQCAQARPRVGWNFGQPSSGWVGAITRVSCDDKTPSYSMTVQVLDGPGVWSGRPVQRACVSNGLVKKQNQCARANPGFSDWLFSNIAWVGSTKWQENATQMVFGNDGAFNAWQPILYGGDELLVAQSIARNIVAAFNRGVANCNNVTMAAPALKPASCARVARLSEPAILKAAAGASDAYWSNERNFYPAGARQNYYAQYLHTQRLGTLNIFAPPQKSFSPTVALSNQGIPMGMAYGFGFDETPGYLSAAYAIPVPAKFDPIPPAWWGSDHSVGLLVGVGKAD